MFLAKILVENVLLDSTVFSPEMFYRGSCALARLLSSTHWSTRIVAMLEVKGADTSLECDAEIWT